MSPQPESGEQEAVAKQELENHRQQRHSEQ
jgi:hypothetical protein